MKVNMLDLLVVGAVMWVLAVTLGTWFDHRSRPMGDR